MKRNKRILFLVPYPLNSAPSQRFRFEQYFRHLESNGFEYSVQCFFNTQNLQIFYQKGHAWRKFMILVKGFLKRFISPLSAISCDFVFIHREATPVGPPVIEWVISRILRKQIIYDFDDAIWSTDRVNESLVLRVSKWRSKVALICKWSYKISCGNEYLQRYALQHNENALVNPTTIDTDYVNKIRSSISAKATTTDTITIGWTGSHSTLKYLKDLEDVLSTILSAHTNVTFCVIADKKPELSFPFHFIYWRPQSEIEDLATFDIGIMPLPDDEWSKGKCGFKILQYMAIRIPAIGSPVGVNSQIITDNINGFLCKDESEWLQKLTLLIGNKRLREQIGAAGHKKVLDYYSVRSNALNFLTLFA